MDAIDALLHKTLDAIDRDRTLPEATYRVQLHSEFTFQDARAIAPYLYALGVSHLYASPYLRARPGSRHGYDITNHQQLNPEIGTEAEYEALVAALRDRGMGQVLDIVPNHMGVVGNENQWWNDVLENGPASPYAGYFDIDWESSPRPALQGKILLPILGGPYGQVLESGQLHLAYEAGSFILRYYDHRFPVDPRSYAAILGHRLDELERALGADHPALVEYQSILTAVRHLPPTYFTDPVKVAERQREKEVIKRRLATLTEGTPAVTEFLARNVADFNGRPGDVHSFDRLDELLAQQAYRLAYWRVASDEINYRRFFDINELAALSMEKPEVFEATHGLVLRLLREGKVQGLRIDHPDGLYDPKGYLQRLQRRYVVARAQDVFAADAEFHGVEWPAAEAALRERLDAAGHHSDPATHARPLYVVVEKILGKDELLPADWPVYGTSGYYFLNMANGLFVDPQSAKAFTRLYAEWLQEWIPFADVVYQKKLLIMRVSLSSEVHVLARQLDRLAQKNRASRDFTQNSLRYALREVIACFPVYRSYITGDELSDEDRGHVQRAVALARRRNPALSGSLFDFIRAMLLLEYPETATEADREEQLRFVGKFQQVTSPVMAKGLEDTAFYVFNRLLSLNEVGGAPDRFGLPPGALHRYLEERSRRWPWAMSASSTHDTKRSEDVRARLNVLSELPDEWRQCLARWRELNAGHFRQLDEVRAPDPNEEYFLYQTLVGAWPLEPYTAEEYAAFVERIQAYMEKAIHEAKVNTSWINPNPAYDDAVHQFIARVLDPEASAAFLHDLAPFRRRVSHYGLLNSLSQTVLKLTAPGVPDVYQGMEVWDFSLVDPDNRRPVDYHHRRRLLEELEPALDAPAPARADLARRLLATKETGQVKLYVTTQALRCRRRAPGLFTAGEYLALEVTGARAEHAFAFLRRRGGQQALVVVPRFFTRLAGPGEPPVGAGVWQDTAVVLPPELAGRRWRNVFTGAECPAVARDGTGAIPLAEVFGVFPYGLLVGEG